MTLAVMVLSAVTWQAVPVEESRLIPVEMWVRRPVLLECGRKERCMEYQVVAYKKTFVQESDGRFQWEHPFDPGDVLYSRFGGCP